MTTRDEVTDIAVDGERIAGTLISPRTLVPGMLFIHGWGVDRDTYLTRAHEIAALGCICLTFDMRGHAATADQRDRVTREDNLRDVVAAYDKLAAHPLVDKSAIAVAGSSYGGYLAAVLTSVRPVSWLALRVPALYKDEDWALPKQALRERGLDAFRRGPVSAQENRALAACAAFEGDVLIVESERDDTVPREVIANYLAAFRKMRSLTYRMIAGADHGLSQTPWQEAYTSLLLNWATEMVISAREGGAAPEAQTELRPAPHRQPPRAA
jgi:dipeptidyl aminopeptidase/acylaminoacyl peptidase